MGAGHNLARITARPAKVEQEETDPSEIMWHGLLQLGGKRASESESSLSSARAERIVWRVSPAA